MDTRRLPRLIDDAGHSADTCPAVRKIATINKTRKGTLLQSRLDDVIPENEIFEEPDKQPRSHVSVACAAVFFFLFQITSNFQLFAGNERN